MKNINTKEENRKVMKYLGISEEKAKELFALTKAFKSQNRTEQERLCSKYNLPQGRTYGCWRYANSFGEFLAKIFAKGEFIPLEEIGEYETLGVFKKCPEFDPEKGWIIPEYIQVRQEEDNEVHYEPIRDYLCDKGLTPELKEFCVEFQTCLYPELGWDIGLDILNLARWDKVLPEDKSEDLKSRLQELSNGGYTTPPAMGDDRYDNGTEPEVWERDEEADLERDLYAPNLQKVLKSLQYLENSSLPKAKEVKASYWGKDGLNVRLLWKDLQQKGYAENLTWEGWEDDPDKGSYEEKTLWSLKALRSLTKEELQTLLEMKEDTLLKNMGYASMQANPCKVYHVDPQTLQGRKHEVKSHVIIPW